MKIRVIGVPSAWGTNESGAQRTPCVLRDAGLLGWLASPGVEVEDGGDVEVPPQSEADTRGSATTDLIHLDEVIAMASGVRAAVGGALSDDALPLVVGGECCLSIGVVPALTAHRGPVTTAWFDAHGDINTPDSSESGLITGMPLAVVMGEGHADLLAVGEGPDRPAGESTWLLGGRDIDPGELANVERFGIRHLRTAEVRARGAEPVALSILRLPAAAIMAIEARAAAGVEAVDPATRPNVYLHFDVDSLDPEWAPGVYYRVEGGFHPTEVSAIAGNLCASGSVGAIAIASANLDHDEDGRTLDSIRSFVTSIADALSMAT